MNKIHTIPLHVQTHTHTYRGIYTHTYMHRNCHPSIHKIINMDTTTHHSFKTFIAHWYTETFVH